MNTIIEKIRAEIERLKEEAYNSISPDEPKYRTHYKVGKKELCEELLSFLSDIEKECEEKPTNIDFEQELYKHFGQVKDFTLGMQIGKYFYELGKQEKPTTAEGLEDILLEFYDEYDSNVANRPIVPRIYAEKLARHFAQWGAEHSDSSNVRFPNYRNIVDKVFGAGNLDSFEYEEAEALVALAKEELLKDIKPKVSDGLEEEIERVYAEDKFTTRTKSSYSILARHFAQWGAEHFRDTTKMISEDLEEAAKQFVGYDMDTDDLRDYEIGVSSFKAGAKWQEEQDLKYISEIYRNGYNLCKEQMMKEAVEGEVVKDISNKLAVTAKIDLDGFKFGDKVRVIVLRKED